MNRSFSRRIVALAAAYAIALNAAFAGLAIGARSAEAVGLTVICGDTGGPAFPAASHAFCPVGGACGLPGCASCGAPGAASQLPDVPYAAVAVLFALPLVPDRAGSALAGRPQARAPPQT